jgi:hypothetical protein
MRYVKMIATGFLLIVLIYVAEFLVTAPFSLGPDATDSERASWLVWEFLLTSIPACLLSFFFAFLFKLHEKKDACIHGAVWTVMYAGAVFLLSVLDSPDFKSSARIFGTPTLYVLFALYFLGPLIYAIFSRKPARSSPPKIEEGDDHVS